MASTEQPASTKSTASAPAAQSPEASTSPTPSDSTTTGYTPGDDGTTRWRNFFSLLTGTMTDAGKAQYKTDRDLQHEEADCKRCEKHRDHLLQYSMLPQWLVWARHESQEALKLINSRG